MAYPDYMLLTLSSPAKHNLDYKSTHDFAAQRTISISSVLSTPPPERNLTSNYFSPAKILGSISSSTSRMTTPHRGLPPPAPLTLPDPSRLPPPLPGQSHSNLPAPPPQWHGMEESMRNWLHTKAEEERRRQEEEKTQQEQLRLEQKKIEQNMLQESIRCGVPPNSLPMLFLALAGAGAAGVGAEVFQQYIAQFTAQTQHMQPASPETGRDRIITQSQSGAYPGPQSVPPTPIGGQYASFAGTRAGTVSGPPSAQRAHFAGGLPRLATESAAGVPSGSQQSSQQQEPQTQISFHHWQPPTSHPDASAGVTHQTPTAQTDYASSPKKRKATGSHQPAPPPSSSLRYSESRSPRATTGHSRQRSDLSARGAPLPHLDERLVRPRAETIATEHSSATDTARWQPHHYHPSSHLQHQPHKLEPTIENPGYGAYDDPSRRPPQIAPGSATRLQTGDERPRSRDDIEMGER
ncbi:hypothetical protein BT63DRAFT_90620 [Microthyrium microscopicum]|uniref:Uncharacterized protein n=1 Tax=Microthyrium microscopicum TaxID=703497 RepID=A0A6A6U050_9PEZI|nr:hypothetical protein BT63DRAFT_90620 [Microthyrium microscopicum]